MDVFLIIIGILLLLMGFVGCVLPVVPGTPLAYLSLVALHFTSLASFSAKQLIVWLILVVAMQTADYLIPMMGVKKFGGSKYGNWGCLIGTVIGVVFFAPWGILIGPFAGAFVGELIAGKKADLAFKAGFGAFVGFLFGTILKIGLCGWFAFCFIRALVQ